MTGELGRGRESTSDALLSCLLCAIDPFGLGGIAVRSRAGHVRDRWLSALRDLLPPGTPFRRLTPGADEHRVFGGLDLSATLSAGRPVEQRGLVAEASGGFLLLSMAERLSPTLAARLGGVLDTGVAALEGDGLSTRHAALIGIVALDEGIDADERLPAALADRLAFWLELDDFDPADASIIDDGGLALARERYPGVVCSDGILQSLCETAVALGIHSLRASVLVQRTARAAAALAGRSCVEDRDAAVAARLVLAPRATRLPAPMDVQSGPETDPAEDTSDPTDGRSDENQAVESSRTEDPLDDVVLAAAQAAIPPGLLARLQGGAAPRSLTSEAGRVGTPGQSKRRGRPAGVRAATPGAGARLNVIATLRAAAPWQRLRARPPVIATGSKRHIEIRRDDLRVTRLKQTSQTTTIFVVDASGSLAANRLAEAKGAVELMLAECYVRRDQVALVSFRGQTAELLLPPTRSLARAKRCLATLPGGGGTPLALAIDAATSLAGSVRRRGQIPVIVFLTDGRANVARDGTGGRARASEDANRAARAASLSGTRMLVVDASPRPQPTAQALAEVLRAHYVVMPRADAGALSRAVHAAKTG